MSKFVAALVAALIIAALVCQVPGSPKYTIIEGNTGYKDPGLGNDPAAIARQNAANISVLQKQIEKYSKLVEEVQDLSSNVHKTGKGVVQLNKQITHCQKISAKKECPPCQGN
jgi:hypothetical protein